MVNLAALLINNGALSLAWGRINYTNVYPAYVITFYTIYIMQEVFAVFSSIAM